MMSRTILIHLNAQVSDDDPRTSDEVADKILAALEVGLEGAPGDLATGGELEDAVVTLAGAEEI